MHDRSWLFDFAQQEIIPKLRPFDLASYYYKRKLSLAKLYLFSTFVQGN